MVRLLPVTVLVALTPVISSGQPAGVVVEGGSATGGSAVGGRATAGSGGNATGGNAVGGSAVGGSVTGGTSVGGSAVGGAANASGGTATSGSVTPGTATATVGGRRISATSDNGVSIQAEGDHARVTFGSDVLVVEAGRILVDGKERASIPLSTDLVQIRNAGGIVTVRAGRNEVLSERLPSR